MLAHCTENSVEIPVSVIASGLTNCVAESNSVVKASRLAHKMTGVGPKDLRVVEVHDAVGPAEVWE